MEESARENHFERRAISLEDNSREDVFLVSEAKTEDTEEMPEESLQTRFARLLSCEDMADVHFLVGGAQRHQRQLRVPAHRLVLAVASPVFRRMFFGAEDESVSLDNCSAEDVVLEDLEPLVFLEFLRFLYTDQIRLQKDNAVAVLYAAKKYEIPFLERLCFRFVNFEISKDNALLIWLSAKTFREPEVESLALRVIRRFAADVLLAPDFVRADHHSVCQLLEDDLLRVQEVDLFLAVTRWAKHQCLRRGQCPTRVHIRHVMAEAVDLIRFPLMTSEQLRTVVQSEGVLEDDVLRALSANQRSWPRKALHFSSTPRAYQRLRGPLLCVQRFASFDNQMAVRAGQRSLRFAANKRIFVAGVGVYGPRRPFHFQLQISVALVRCDRRASPTIMDCARKSVRVKSGDSSEPIVNIKFDEEFEIEPNVEHEIRAEVEATERPVGGVRAHLPRAPHDVHFFYGTGGQLAAKVRTTAGENVIFNFAWDHECADATGGASSAPPTPNPPPRPPPPAQYRRPSRLARLKRALSFTEKTTGSDERSAGSDVTCGQIPVILFFA